MTTYAITKPAKGKKAGSGSGAKKASSGTKKSSSSKTAQEQAGKESQPADEPVAVHSYTALLSGNGKYRIARFKISKFKESHTSMAGDFDLPFEWQYPADASDNWSTQAQLDE